MIRKAAVLKHLVLNIGTFFLLYMFPYPFYYTAHAPIYGIQCFYSITTVAPISFIVLMIFSASSLGTFSFIILGALSTNFLLSTKLRPSRLLTSLMTLALDAASMPCSFRVKRCFSAAAGATSSASSATGAAAGAAAKPPTGRSGMLSLFCRKG
jgi:hypothetical protein